MTTSALGSNHKELGKGKKEAGIYALATAQDEAWAANDGAAFAATFTEDALYINVNGASSTGRAPIQAVHELLLGPSIPFNPVAGLFRDSVQTLTVTNIRYITKTSAIVDVAGELTCYKGLPPGLRETYPGRVRLTSRWVVKFHAGEWLIESSQSTPLPPPAPFPPPPPPPPPPTCG